MGFHRHAVFLETPSFETTAVPSDGTAAPAIPCRGQAGAGFSGPETVSGSRAKSARLVSFLPRLRGSVAPWPVEGMPPWQRLQDTWALR